VYDGIRFILPDAIRRAGTQDTEAVNQSLGNANVETLRRATFVFTSSHDIMIGTDEPKHPAEDYVVMGYFQWQSNKALVPMKPTEIMKEANAHTLSALRKALE